MLVLPHFHMCERDLVPRKNFAHARVDTLFQHETVCERRLFEMRKMRALNAFLTHPYIARIECEIVTGGPRTEDHHTAALDDEAGYRKRLLTRMFEDDVDSALARDVPDRLAETARFLCPVIELWRVHRGHLAPAFELFAIDHALGAKIENVFDLRFIGYDSDGVGAGRRHKLHAEYAETA